MAARFIHGITNEQGSLMIPLLCLSACLWFSTAVAQPIAAAAAAKTSVEIMLAQRPIRQAQARIRYKVQLTAE